MPSLFTLIHESASDLRDRARETDGVRVSMTKSEHIQALADEEVGPKAMRILDANRDTLEAIAHDKGGFDPSDYSVPQLQETFLRVVCRTSDAKRGGFPDSGYQDRRPMSDLSSHYDDPEVRWMEITRAAKEMAQQAVEEGRSYKLVESFRPKDKTEPLIMMRSTEQHHPDQVVVAEMMIPQWTYPLKTARKNPVGRHLRDS